MFKKSKLIYLFTKIKIVNATKPLHYTKKVLEAIGY